MGIGGDRLGRGRARGKKRNSRGMRFLDVDWIYAIRESRGRWRFCRHGFVRDVDGIGFFFCFCFVVSPLSSKEGSSFSVSEPMKCDGLEDRSLDTKIEQI